MYKHILVPVLIGEGNEPHAAFDAAKLLADGGAEITVLHIMEAMPGFVR